MDVPAYLYPRIGQTLDDASDYIRTYIARKHGVTKIPIPKDIVDWAHARFYIPSTQQPIVLAPHQQAVLRLAFTRDASGHFPCQTLLFSTIKQSGKSTIAGVILRWYAETQQRYSELYCVGNDRDQAMTRSFREVRWSIEQSPGYDNDRDRLPGAWSLLRTIMRCQITGSEIRALAVDSKGEAGGKPALQVWTELWGFEQEEALRFWDELTPIPTIPDSMRIVETYAGYENESALLKSLYDTGKAGHQLSAGELSVRTGCALGVFAEATHPDDPVPIWHNPAASQIMYWDSGPAARRLPWQLNERAAEYYAAQAITLLPAAFDRLHYNYWTASTGQFITREMWNKCYDPSISHVPGVDEKGDPLLGEPLLPGDKTPLVMAVDAATSNDCFGIVLVSRHPDPKRHETDVCIRGVKVFDPKESGGKVDYDDAERFIRFVCEGGHVMDDGQTLHPRSLKTEDCQRCDDNDHDVLGYNVVCVTYDPYQLESMMQRIARDRVVWCDQFNQGGERLVADKGFYDGILGLRITHYGDPRMTQHVMNAGAKLQKDEDSKLRLVKTTASKKIDLAVSGSMAVAKCLELVL